METIFQHTGMKGPVSVCGRLSHLRRFDEARGRAEGDALFSVFGKKKLPCDVTETLLSIYICLRELATFHFLFTHRQVFSILSF